MICLDCNFKMSTSVSGNAYRDVFCFNVDLDFRGNSNVPGLLRILEKCRDTHLNKLH